jgi:glycosyltransferase involved in cell wall biosynthesis
LYNFFPELNDIKPQYKKGNYFLYYGRLSEEKGIITLLNAWGNLNSRFVLKIVGDGPLKEEILSFIEDYKMENVQYLGFKYKKELSKIITNSSFIFVPSEWYENNPLTIIESYSYGKPVIASKTGGIPEIVLDKKTGYLFKMRDVSELTDVILNASNISKKEYIGLSKNARELAVKLFYGKSHYQALLKIYHSMI